MPRTPRPQRSPVPALDDFAQLDRTHKAALDMLAAFDRMLAQLDSGSPDSGAQQSARRIIDFFAGPGAEHHADEERLVFPPLLASGNSQLVAFVHRLQQDHGWIEEDWLELAPQVEAIATGYNWYDLPMLCAALPIFTALYQDHIALEEALIYPAAKRHAQALQHGQAERSSSD